ncbi:MAG: transposase [Eubacteriales bacterium]|nr:transposase [Eubacteriales bacterium]
MGRRTFSREYKKQTIKQVLEEGLRVTEVADALRISEQTIYRWLREQDKYGEEAFKGPGNARIDSEYRIKVLEKQNQQLEQENEILKKYRAFLKGKRKRR